ncbi:MAG: hypothetical protein ACK46X_11635 [Candidatus Sericytochromatia bacterium]
MKAPLISAMLALSLTGCNAGALLTPAPGGNKQPAGTSQGLSPLRLGSLNFQAASADTMARMSQQAAGTPAPMAAESGRSAGAADASMTVGKAAVMPSPYAYGSYFGGPFGQMKLDGVQEAKAAGASAGFLELQNQLIAPALADWATDARMVNTNGTLTETGDPVTASENFPEEFAWHATYASISRAEVLEFHVTAKETRVVRLKWSPVTIDVKAAQVDAKAAVEKLTQAIRSRQRSKEEELGRDYFFQPGDQGRIAIDPGVSMPAIAVGEPAPGYQGPTTEVRHELKAGGRWYVNLQQIGDHLVWELNYNAHVAPAMTTPSSGPISADAAVSSPAIEPAKIAAPAPVQPEPWVDENAYGMIDARTGEVIRMRRPTKYTYPAVTPEMSVLPGEKPTPMLR